MHPMKAGAQNHSHLHAPRTAATRFFLLALFIVLGAAKPAFALSWWNTSAPYTNWSSIASSADGTRIVATVFCGWSGGIYRSEDSGATWTQTSAPITNWSSIASSADGRRLVAAGTWACAPGPLYVSTNSGTTWTQTSAPIGSWCSVASSADGKRLIAAGFDKTPVPFISTDFGVTWTETTVPCTNCRSVTSSADGQQLAAATSEETIFISTNAGSSWNIAGPPARGSCASLSGDGRVLVVVGAYDHPICVSTNLGGTWTVTPVPLNTDSGWCATSSADGSKWVIGGQRYLYTSTNYGTTWERQENGGFVSIASSADGSKLVGVNGTHIYTSIITSPQLSMSSSGNALRLSWPSYISSFAVQTTPDLALTNWANVEATPSLSNGHYQVTFTPTNSQSFFRLRHP
jgi:hypothetical protein